MPWCICTGFCCFFFFFLGPTESACTDDTKRNTTERAPAGPVLMDVNHRVFCRIAARLYTRVVYRVTAQSCRIIRKRIFDRVQKARVRREISTTSSAPLTGVGGGRKFGASIVLRTEKISRPLFMIRAMEFSGPVSTGERTGGREGESRNKGRPPPRIIENEKRIKNHPPRINVLIYRRL